MKQHFACLLVVLLGACAAAQGPANATRPVKRAVIDGTVSKDPGGEPVKKALIELIAENQAEGGDYTAVTGADGVFHIEGIVPGRYRLFAERTGFLEVDKHHARSEEPGSDVWAQGRNSRMFRFGCRRRRWSGDG